jgi:hypothetical protein
MFSITITFDTSFNSNFKWFDSFESLINEKLDEILIHRRTATIFFVVELSDRRESRKNQTIEKYYDKLSKNASLINRKELNVDHTAQLKDENVIIANSDLTQSERSEITLARSFLWIISRVIEWSHALLVLCALGKTTVQKLKENQRLKLIKHTSSKIVRLSFVPHWRQKQWKTGLTKNIWLYLFESLYVLIYYRHENDPSANRGLQKTHV